MKIALIWENIFIVAVDHFQIIIVSCQHRNNSIEVQNHSSLDFILKSTKPVMCLVYYDFIKLQTKLTALTF